MADITAIHDKFVKKLLADTQVAADYFKTALPPHIAGKLDFSTLYRRPGNYVSKALEQTFSDIVYTCELKDRKEKVEISLLLEHKSAPDTYTPVQIGGYLFSAYRQQLLQRKLLTPVIPVLLYHGKKRWKYRTLDHLFDHLDPDLLVFLPKYEYIYHSLRDLSDKEIRAIENGFLIAALLLLKHAFDKPGLKSRLAEIFSIGLAQGSNAQQVSLVIYGFELVDLPEEQVKDILETLPSDIKDKVMSTYDLLVEKGRKEERARAQKLIEQERHKAQQKSYDIVSNLLASGKFTILEIAGFAAVTEDFVRKVSADLTEKK
ncbi:Rpn family recombination-promoting nuclease/putative transposase [Sinomicrobium soli]|uniref:Rpn family recombination-promoting nuclease/putative transposase n=1 Tax=Sinomicrobium sp. N-1-3-6 TaxID=2219864 RepID=UPI000DCD72D5|nr:Rpn family recombination-promoting nuclease/putative transposase [Sinomicrobium sp. N-1-3-6]RAV27923.1 hypothetical protein DN748_16090 [Sinomicrobium sp. N-1-3-6]